MQTVARSWLQRLLMMSPLGPDWFPATVLAIGVASILFATAFAVLARSY